MSRRKPRQACAHASGSTSLRTRRDQPGGRGSHPTCQRVAAYDEQHADQDGDRDRDAEQLEPPRAGWAPGDGQEQEAHGRRREAHDVERQRVHHRAGQPLGGGDAPRVEHRHPERQVAGRWRDRRHQDRALVVDRRPVGRDPGDVERERQRVEDLADHQDDEEHDRLPPAQVAERVPHLRPVDRPHQADDDERDDAGDREQHQPADPRGARLRREGLGHRPRPAGQKSTGSRMIGQVMQCPPPRPRPSSAPTIVITSTPALRSSVLVSVLRS